MLFKSFKVHYDYIELQLNTANNENLKIFLKLINCFGLYFGNLLCSCFYDEDIINIKFKNDEVNVENIETDKKFIRTIHLKETNIIINSIETLQSLLKISIDYDAMLIFKSLNESNNEYCFIVNDNGHDYIKFDNSKYDKKAIKTQLNQIFKQ